MKKIIIALLALMLVLVSCDISVGGGNGTIPDEPDEPTPPGQTTSIDLLNRGDFEDFSVDQPVNAFNWGASNGTVVEIEGNKVVRIDASDAYQELYYNNFLPFTGSEATLSANIKLENAEDASNVTLKLTVLSDADADNTLIEYTGNPEATTDWQTVTVDIPAFTAEELGGYIFQTSAKVSVDAGVTSVLVDDVKLEVKDRTAVNWLPYGDFEYAASKAAQVQEYWKIIEPSGWVNVSIDGTDDKYVTVDAGEILIGRTLVPSGDPNDPNYPTANVDYPNAEDGVVRLTIQGDEGTIFNYELKAKNPAEEQPGTNVFVGEVAIESDGVFDVEIPFPAVDGEQNETEIQIKSNGNLKVYDISLHLAD